VNRREGLKPAWLKNKRVEAIKENLKGATSAIAEAITKDEILRTIKKLKKEKASGIDKIPAEILRVVTEEDGVAKYFTILFNKILNKHINPKKWYENMIFTIYKSGSSHEAKNFRLITLINVIYKVYINIINKRLTGIIEKKKVLSNVQAGFREN
jgi:hypothetical protein